MGTEFTITIHCQLREVKYQFIQPAVSDSMAYFVGAEHERTTVRFGTVKMRMFRIGSSDVTNLGTHCILVTDVSFELVNITSNQSGRIGIPILLTLQGIVLPIMKYLRFPCHLYRQHDR
jgi:hypothetical protein